LVKKLWVKFSGMDIECVCEPHHRKCRDKNCAEYVVSFTEIDRTNVELANKLNKETKNLNDALKKFQTEVYKT